MDLVRSLGRFVQPPTSQERSLEVVVVNLTSCEVRLPEFYALVLSGDLHLTPEMFDAAKSLLPGQRGSFVFAGTGGLSACFSAAVEIVLVEDSGKGLATACPPRLFLGGRGPLLGPSRLAVQWQAGDFARSSTSDAFAPPETRGARQRTELLKFQEECPALPLDDPAPHRGDGGSSPISIEGESFCAWISRSKCGASQVVTVTLRENYGLPTPLEMQPLQSGAQLESPGASSSTATPPMKPEDKSCSMEMAGRIAMPLASRRKWLLISIINYTGVSLTFPPDFARGVAAGEAWKEKAYIGPQQSGQLAFADDLHFSALAFCSLSDDHERLYFEASNPLIGANTFSVFFARRGSAIGSSSGSATSKPGSSTSSSATVLAGLAKDSLAAALRPGAPTKGVGFMGASSDATVRGKSFEALVTDARYGDEALATVALYPRRKDKGKADPDADAADNADSQPESSIDVSSAWRSIRRQCQSLENIDRAEASSSVWRAIRRGCQPEFLQ